MVGAGSRASGPGPVRVGAVRGLVTVAGMGLVTAWVLVALTVLAALACAAGALRLTRHERTERPR